MGFGEKARKIVNIVSKKVEKISKRGAEVKFELFVAKFGLRSGAI